MVPEPIGLQARYDAIKTKIAQAATTDVHLLAVSKGQTAHAIADLYALGQRDFGENYVGELLQKRETLAATCPEIKWHFLGKLQTNKIAQLDFVYMVHSVARAIEADLLSKGANEPTCICLQINIGREQQKNGIMPEHAIEVAREILQIKNISLVGLMVIPPEGDRQQTKMHFQALARLRDEMEKTLNVSLPELSMGMSSDFEEAIAAGATWVRIGTALFGGIH